MVTERVTKKVTAKLTANEQEVLNIIFEHPEYSMSDIADKLSVSRKTVASHIKALKEKGITTRVGAAQNRNW